MTRDDVELAKIKAETAEIKYRLARAKAAEERAQERDALRLASMQCSVALAEEQLTQQQINTSKAKRDDALLRSDWRFDHTLNFVGSVSKDTVQSSIDKLHQYHVMDPGCEITLTFNSPGGSVIDGMALFDYIRFMRDAGHRVTIIALGYAASMAGILLQAADHRVMARGAWLLIHEVAFGVSGKIGEIEDMYEFGKRLKEQAADIFVDRSGGKLSREVLDKNWYRKDWWISPKEALELGLIDEIR